MIRWISECSVAASGILAVLEVAVCCSSGSLSCSVAADGVKADLADNIVLLVEYLVKRKLKRESSKCLSRSLHKCGLQ